MYPVNGMQVCVPPVFFPPFFLYLVSHLYIMGPGLTLSIFSCGGNEILNGVIGLPTLETARAEPRVDPIDLTSDDEGDDFCLASAARRAEMTSPVGRPVGETVTLSRCVYTLAFC